MRPRALAWCDTNDDLDRAVSLFAPLAPLPALDARLVSGAVLFVERAVELRHPDAALLVALDGVERMLVQDFRSYRPMLESVRALATEGVPLTAGAAVVVGYAALIAGDVATFEEMNEAAADLPGGVRRGEVRLIGQALRIVARGHEDRAGVARLVEVTERLPSAIGRGGGYVAAAMAALVADPERVGELAHRALDLYPEGCSLWLGAYHPLALWHLGRGELGEAIGHATVAAAAAVRLGERSGLIPPLVAHALVLQHLDDAEGAATVRGALPRRWTVFATDQQSQLDAWLAERLPDNVHTRLVAKGAAMDIEELLAIAPAALARRK
jgi:hypothetical protein